MAFDASWPRCMFCASTAAPNATLDRELRCRADAAWAQAHTDFEQLQKLHEKEDERAALVATLLVATMLAAVGILDALF